MKAHPGTCGLCREPGELRESHLLPSSAYKLARESDRKDPNPVVVTGGRSYTTSRHIVTPFLCPKCEDRFSRLGERYVMNQCGRRGSFKLRALLEGASPICEDERFRVYDVAPLLGTKVDQYLYFAASVFWRAAARTWTFDARPLERLSLGATYQEQFRLYLLEEAGFPQNARLFVHVWSDRVDFTTVLPCTFRLEGVRRHKFCIPGILFILFLGRDVPSRYDVGALNGSADRFMWLCRWQDDSLFRGFAEQIARSTRSGSLQRRQAG